MATSLVFLLFGTLAVVVVAAMVKIQRAEYFEAREAERNREQRMKAYRAKCSRPDGD